MCRITSTASVVYRRVSYRDTNKGFFSRWVKHAQSILFLITIFFSAIADAENMEMVFDKTPSYQTLSFSNIKADEISSLSVIVAIEQDDHGFIWLGGKNGIIRFDGYEAVLYRYEPGKPDGLGSNDISDLHFDQRGQLWIAQLSGGGLSRYDSSRRRFVHYSFSDSGENAGSIYAIEEDAEGNIWLGTHGKGLIKYDQDTGVFTPYTSDTSLLSDNVIRDIAIDQEGYIWLATATQGLNRFDPKSKLVKVFFHDPGNKNSLSENTINKVFVDRSNNIWVGTFSQGLSLLKQGTNEFINYKHDIQDVSSLGRGVVWDITEDSYGSIWVATGSGDLNRFDGQKKIFHRIRHLPYSPQGISGPPTAIFSDNAGRLWIGSYFSNVDYVDLSTTKFSSIDLSKIDGHVKWPRNITALTIDQNENIWMATDNGLAEYDFSKKSLTYIVDDSSISGKIPDFPIRSILSDVKGDIWVGTYGGGLSLYQRKNKKIIDIGSQAKLESNKVWSLYQDKYNDIWVGTQTAGLAKYDRENNQFNHYYGDERHPSKLPNNFVWDIFGDSKNNLWVGTQHGLVKTNLGLTRVEHYFNFKENPNSLSSNSVRAITEDDEGDIWVATNSGLNRYDRSKNIFDVYRIKDGLIDDSISSISHDKYGNLWLASQKGLSRFNIQDKAFDHFDHRHGVIGNSFPRRAVAQNSEGYIFFGNSKGITAIDPEVNEKNNFIPPVIITGLRLSNQIVDVGEDTPLKKEIFYSNEIFLPNNHSSITFEFAALSYHIPSQNQYAYRLEGLDKDWHYVDSSDRMAVYTNLDPGRYTFYVKGSNNDGLWNETPAQLAIVIPPPWYMTWWSQTLAVIMMFMIIYSYVFFRLRINHLRQQQLQKNVREKTTELATANQEIQELNQELEARVARRTNELSVEIEERRLVEEKLSHMAFHDALTGLPNRYWLVQELKAHIEQIKKDKKTRFALLFLDGDRFKQVNDTHGHVLGDQLLILVAMRLKRSLPDDHHVVRLGGDEFTILIDRVETIDMVKSIAQSVIDIFEQPFYPDQNKIFFKVSIGMVICEEFYTKPEQILRDADIALYRAKDKGKGIFQIFDSQMREETMELSELENDLHSAVINDELFLHFQPIVDLDDGILTGFEALLRWNHPKKGLIAPDTFIPIAEEAGLITHVGLIALEKACDQLFKWKQQFNFHAPLVMSVNLSSLQLNQPDLVERVDDILQQYDIDGRWIKLEITESALMEKNKDVSILLDHLRERNIVLVIDDFGTGYSSLSYLDQLPVEVLKIDRSFVSGISSSQTEGGAIEIVRATISLAHSLRMFVVAEGIETKDQLNVLSKSGCDYGQGYWVSKPLDVDKTTDLISHCLECEGILEKVFYGHHSESESVDKRSRRRNKEKTQTAHFKELAE